MYLAVTKPNLGDRIIFIWLQFRIMKRGYHNRTTKSPYPHHHHVFKKSSKLQIGSRLIFMRHNVSFHLHISNRNFLQNYGNGKKIDDDTFFSLRLIRHYKQNHQQKVASPFLHPFP